MASGNPLSIGAFPVGANVAYGIGPSVATTIRTAGAMSTGVGPGFGSGAAGGTSLPRGERRTH